MRAALGRGRVVSYGEEHLVMVDNRIQGRVAMRGLFWGGGGFDLPGERGEEEAMRTARKAMSTARTTIGPQNWQDDSFDSMKFLVGQVLWTMEYLCK